MSEIERLNTGSTYGSNPTPKAVATLKENFSVTSLLQGPYNAGVPRKL